MSSRISRWAIKFHSSTYLELRRWIDDHFILFHGHPRRLFVLVIRLNTYFHDMKTVRIRSDTYEFFSPRLSSKHVLGPPHLITTCNWYEFGNRRPARMTRNCKGENEISMTVLRAFPEPLPVSASSADKVRYSVFRGQPP